MSNIAKTDLEWFTEKRRVDDLIPYEKNPRKMNPKQISDLKKSLIKFNLVEIPAIDVDGRIIAGHQRLKILQLLGRGQEEIDVRVPNRKLTEEEYKSYLITSNAVMGEWDFEKLKSFDLDMLIDVGMEKNTLADMWSQHLEADDDSFPIEKELENIKEPITKLGDLIIMGPHRLICGSSTDPKVLKRLLGEERASVIYSDPPYNISLDYNKGIGNKQNYGGNVNDSRSYGDYKDFLRQTMKCALDVAHPDSHIFYWSDQKFIGLIQELYRELGIENKRVCLWIKNSQNPVPGVAFNKCYEPCTYGIRGKPFITKSITNLNEILNKEITTGNNLMDEALDHLDLWFVKRLSGKEYQHATSKPPQLHNKAIRRCTNPGDIILDSFSGSASTMIAAHQLKRRVFASELEPIFCDLAIRRYEALTGEKAKIIRQ